MAIVIIAGSRGINSYDVVDKAIRESKIENNFGIDEIVHGNCPNSPDLIGELWATVHRIPFKKFPAKWGEVTGKPDNEIGINRFGKKYWKMAGYSRNEEMAKYADALIAVWDGKSGGTKDMINKAKENNLIVFVYEVK